MILHTLTLRQACIGWLALAVWTLPASAQTRFVEPGLTVDVSQYTAADQCIAAVYRISGAEVRQELMSRDTLPLRMDLIYEPWSADAVATARRCSDQWSVESDAPDDFRWLFELFLIAGREADAKALLRHRLAAVALDTVQNRDSIRAYLLSTATEVYLHSRPSYLVDADSLLRELSTFSERAQTRMGLLGGLWLLRGRANGAGNQALALQIAQRAEDEFAKLTKEDRISLWFRGHGAYSGLINSRLLHHREGMDSLRRSTEAYFRWSEKYVQQLGVGDLKVADLVRPVGKVESIPGAFWFPQAPNIPRPTRGKVSLVYPMGKTCTQGEVRFMKRCGGFFALLRRLGQRFPDVEITLLTHIDGYYTNQAPLSAENEAELKRWWLLEIQKLPAMLAIEQSSFVRLANPDRRSINTYWTLAGMEDYGQLGYGGGEQDVGRSSVIVVDQEGNIVGRVGLMLEMEPFLVEMLDILLKREG